LNSCSAITLKVIMLKQNKNNMYYRTYIELITFCKYLPIRQLIAYKDAVKEMKNKEFLIAREVLKIRISKKYKALQKL